MEWGGEGEEWGGNGRVGEGGRRGEVNNGSYPKKRTEESA